jgi:hypothetical protein
MTDGDEFISSFEERQIKRQDDFQASTLKAVLKQLSWTPKQIAVAQREAGEDMGWEWFNAQDLIPVEVTSKRIFSYNFAEVFTAPHKSQAAQVYFDAYDTWAKTPRTEARWFAMIFKVHGGGRVLFTDYTAIAGTLPRFLLPIRKGRVHSLMTFSQFFSRHFGNPELDDVEELYPDLQ